jgi:hypothetical protein
MGLLNENRMRTMGTCRGNKKAEVAAAEESNVSGGVHQNKQQWRAASMGNDVGE